MPDATPATLELVRTEGVIPPPDNLIAGNLGALYVDVVKLSAQGEHKRGTLLMASTDGYAPCTQAGLSTAGSFCILTDDTTIGENEYAEVPAYFQGEFNDARVIFPFEGEDDDHDAIVETAREPLRRSKIFMRHLHEKGAAL
ncbi:MAG: hypothetical protein IJR63_02495 [Synergistaceae bacterium]|nr:hypothetical protein [Synergistaceae bacterium]